MTQKDKADVFIYLKELITEYQETATYVPLKVIASQVRKKFPKLYPTKNCPSAGTISRYLHDIGYKFSMYLRFSSSTSAPLQDILLPFTILLNRLITFTDDICKSFIR